MFKFLFVVDFFFRYPKDAEKHLLAVKSGLTRSQVLEVSGKSLNGECNYSRNALVFLLLFFHP